MLTADGIKEADEILYALSLLEAVPSNIKSRQVRKRIESGYEIMRKKLNVTQNILHLIDHVSDNEYCVHIDLEKQYAV